MEDGKEILRKTYYFLKLNSDKTKDSPKAICQKCTDQNLILEKEFGRNS